MSLCFELCDIFCFIVSLLYFLFSSDFVFVRVQGSFLPHFRLPDYCPLDYNNLTRQQKLV